MLVLGLLDFHKIFEVNCDALEVSIEVLFQELKLVIFFSEKCKGKAVTYEEELYVVVRSLQQCESYMVQKESSSMPIIELSNISMVLQSQIGCMLIGLLIFNDLLSSSSISLANLTKLLMH